MTPKARRTLLARYRITDGATFSLAGLDPAETPGLTEAQSVRLLADGVDRLAELQRSLYANARWAVLAVFQAMDAGGKDGTIAHVMSGVNPQGVHVTAFKQPGPVELAHDFLWRIHAQLPERGHIGIFNRSHYEEVLVTRLHPDIVDRQKLPDPLRGKGFWKHRYKDIRHFERYVARQGIVPLKFFLHISREEQRQRLLARLEDRAKSWKFSSADLKERALWDGYQQAYEQAVVATATRHAPWFVVPADKKWFARLVVVEAMIDAIERLSLKPPEPLDQAEMARARALLQADG